MSERKVYGPDREECAHALWVARDAQKLVTAILNKASIAEPFQDLCHGLRELENNILGAITTDERAEDLTTGRDWSDAVFEIDQEGEPRYYKVFKTEDES